MTNRDHTPRPLRVGLISLGCAKNLVDAEVMLGSLLKTGAEITNDAASADAVIVNTCSFIDAAQEESIDAILETAKLRDAKQPRQGVVVAGCLPQRFRDELPKLLPEVDAFMGIDQVEQAGRIIREAIERRAQRLAEGPEARGPRVEGRGSKSKVQSPKSKVQRLAAQNGEAFHTKGGIAPAPAATVASTTETLQPLLTQHATRNTFPANHAPTLTAPLVDVTPRPRYVPDYATPRFRLTPRHFAYVKIAEGCNHPCSFCIIPRMRGSHRSRALDDIVAEAQQLLAAGVKELNLISQDSTYYGLDLGPRRDGSIAAPAKFRAATSALPADAPRLCTLLRALNAVPGDFWIRLLYTHPAHWTDELIATITQCPKVARYVDMPLQHIHDNMLQRMRRETSRQYIEDLIARIRAGIPGIALRTTFIVGFPGETEACFASLLEFIRQTRFERLGVFTYSKEQGTVAGKMSGQIPERVKQRRREHAMAEQRKIAIAIGEGLVGRTIQVLVEGRASVKDAAGADVFSWEHGLIRQPAMRNPQSAIRHCSVARGEADAPDIDGRVFIRGALPAGEFARVKVVRCTNYDLLAEPA